MNPDKRLSKFKTLALRLNVLHGASTVYRQKPVSPGHHFVARVPVPQSTARGRAARASAELRYYALARVTDFHGGRELLTEPLPYRAAVDAITAYVGAAERTTAPVTFNVL